MQSAKPMLPIAAADLLRFAESATTPILQAKWRPRSSARTGDTDPTKIRESLLGGKDEVVEFSLGTDALSIGRERAGLPNEDGVHLVHAVRRGFQIGLYLADVYAKQTGLDRDRLKNVRQELTEVQINDMQKKNETASAILLFVAANYVRTKLSRYKSDQIGDAAADLPGAIEISLMDTSEAMRCFVFYLDLAVKAKGVDTGAAAIQMAIAFCNKVIDEIRLRIAAKAFGNFADSFTESAYKLEDEDFSITGFETDNGTRVSASFNPVRFEQIKGNRDAKHNARRSIQRLICFDFKVKRNPFMDAFGEFPFISLGKGRPGTGKTMIARAKATLLGEICEALGIPWLFWPLPEDLVSEYQGKTAKQTVAWTRAFADPTRLKYGLVDDAENVFKSREGTTTNEGQDAVNGVFLRFTEGAQAPRDGSWILDLLTNLPEKFDPAILSRIPYRFDVNGAETVEDFLDQDYDWWSGIKKTDPDFVDMKDPPGYVYGSTQGQVSNLSKVYEKNPWPKGEVLKKIFDEERKHYGTDEHMFYGRVFYRLHQEFPKYFTSREVRNIQSLVNNRRADFDFPEEWLKKPDAFVARAYDEKVKMLLNLQHESLGGLTLKTARLQETVQYLTVTLSIAEDARKREFEQRRDSYILDLQAQAAAKAFIAGTGGQG